MRLVAFWCIGFVVVGLVPQIERAAIRATIEILLFVLRGVFADVKLVGNEICLLGISFEVVSDCTPLVGALLLSGAIFAYPADPSEKAIGIVGAILLVWAYDIARITALILVLASWPKAFDLVHVYLWQTLTIVVVVGLFLLWTNRMARRVAA